MNQPFNIAKLDEEECLAFGFANVSIAKSTSNGPGGHEIEDLQDDQISPEELEKAAYLHVEEFREADEMHRGDAIGHLVESIVFTPDKLRAFATDPTTGAIDSEVLDVLKRVFPPRWWVGYRLNKQVFAKVKSGEYRMFSIGGEAEKE